MYLLQIYPVIARQDNGIQVYNVVALLLPSSNADTIAAVLCSMGAELIRV